MMRYVRLHVYPSGWASVRDPDPVPAYFAADLVSKVQLHEIQKEGEDGTVIAGSMVCHGHNHVDIVREHPDKVLQMLTKE